MALKIETTVRQYRRVYLYGATKSGKTTTAAAFPKPIIAQDSEMRGADFLPMARVTIDTAQSFTQFVSDLAAEKEYQTVVLDDFGNMIRRWVAANQGKGDPRAAYKAVYAVIMPQIAKLLAQPRHLVITGHVNREMEMQPNADKERPWIHPNLPDALETYVLGMFDLICYTYNNGHANGLCFESATAQRRIVAGSRVGLAFTQFAAKNNGIVSLDTLAQEVIK